MNKIMEISEKAKKIAKEGKELTQDEQSLINLYWFDNPKWLDFETYVNNITVSLQEEVDQLKKPRQ